MDQGSFTLKPLFLPFFFFLKKIFIYLAVPGSLIFSVDMWDI